MQTLNFDINIVDKKMQQFILILNLEYPNLVKQTEVCCEGHGMSKGGAYRYPYVTITFYDKQVRDNFILLSAFKFPFGFYIHDDSAKIESFFIPDLEIQRWQLFLVTLLVLNFLDNRITTKEFQTFHIPQDFEWKFLKDDLVPEFRRCLA